MDIASEYRYRNPVVGPGDLVIGISQSGETADTLAAMRLARERGATVLAITNVMGSQATRDADGVLFTRAGPGDRGGRHQDVRLPGRRHSTCSACASPSCAARCRRRGSPSWWASSSACRTASPRSPARRRMGTPPDPVVAQVRRIAEQHWDKRVLPLHRPPRRAAGRARGGAQAQGDLLHRHRRLRRRGDEARPDRPARRLHPGGLRRHRLPGAGEGRLQHPGGPRPRRSRDRRCQRGQRSRSSSTPTPRSLCPRSTGCSSRSSP